MHLGFRLQGSDRLRYTNIIQGQHRVGLSPTGVGLHPGPGLIGGGGHRGANPARRFFAQACVRSSILPEGLQRALAGRPVTGIA